MIIHNIVFGFCVLGFTAVHGYISIIKTVGTDASELLTIRDLTTDINYYEVDLYYNQYIRIHVDGDGRNVFNIDPLEQYSYYTLPKNQSLIGAEKREKINIVKTLPINVEKSGNDFKLYYNDNEKPKKIVKMYLDLLGRGSAVVGVVQINVMPELEYIGPEDVTDYSKLIDRTRVVRYYKEMRQGVKWKGICDISNRKTLRAPKKKFTSEQGKIEYTSINTALFVPDSHGIFEVDLSDGTILGNDMELNSNCVQNDRTNLKIYNYSKYMGLCINGVDRPRRLYQGILDIESKNVIAIDVPRDLLFPDCLVEFVDPFNRIVSTKNYLKGSKLTNISKTIKILDIGRASRYNNITLKCKVEKGKNSPDLYLHVRPNCDLTKPENIDKNRISCTVFMDQTVLNYTIHKDKEHSVRKVMGANFYYMEEEEDITLRSKFKIIPSSYLGTGAIKVTETPEQVKINISRGFKVKNNPIFMLVEDKKNELKGIVRIYVHSDSAKTKIDNSLGFILKLDLSNRRTTLRCDKLLGKGYSLYPKGKNTVYTNINNIDKHPTEFETAQFEDLFGSSGVTILKKPETNSDLEIILDDGYEITADHYRPIYFICSKGNSSEENKILPEKYTVIAVDPIYTGVNYRGCGMRPNLFVDSQDKPFSGDSCTFDLSKTEDVRFHCPDYVPEQFLEEDQEKYRSDESEESHENPFKTLFRCYNRTSFMSRFFNYRTEVNVFKKRKSVSELRSLWSFDKRLMRDQGIKSVVCACYNKQGEPKSKIRVTI
ncbi:conserved hypothetical protein [Theileria orientalis strain Shintoku]|uniref:Uncharacterized protein n=1 Tax=Theileria orientalis strain Shintoku TaxID=869250 RepID=J4D8A8_THEOR|nr:conserved hypothetical protein [Theileria orientalis strain Shintoku]BAM40680.1 conserved hypothetical protein [Theileria orientalis strain Shintoku]|eukprot:XP_009690981.1 conserved hypothetical protein [Theileria orientalis strain Shintoku]